MVCKMPGKIIGFHLVLEDANVGTEETCLEMTLQSMVPILNKTFPLLLDFVLAWTLREEQLILRRDALSGNHLSLVPPA